MKIQRTQLHNNIQHTESILQELSFKPLLRYLHAQLESCDHTFLRIIVDKINELESRFGSLNQGNIEDFQDVFTHLFYLSTNVVSPQANFWSIGEAVPSHVIFGQQEFYDFVDTQLELVEESIETPPYQNLLFANKILYILILERLYGLPLVEVKQLFKKEINGVAQYYQLKIDFSFVDVAPIENLPFVDLGFFRERDIKSFDDIIPLLEMIDLRKFKFSGISIIKFLDKTRDHMANAIQKLINNVSHFDREHIGVELGKIVQTIGGSSNLYCSFIPLLEMNGYPLFTSGLCENSIYIGQIILKSKSSIKDQLYNYLQNPYTISYGIEKEFNSLNENFQTTLKDKGIESYVCFPLKQRNRLVGFLEVYSYDDTQLATSTYVNISSIMPLIAHLADDIIRKFKNSLDTIILENYTSLQPAVQWRFNQVAARFISEQTNNPKNAVLEKIDFKKIYPLHGNIDIRNSTKLRNFAYRQDSFQRIGLLQLIVDQIEFSSQKDNYERFINRFNTVKSWLDEGRIEQFLLDIVSFFQEDVFTFLDELNEKDPLLQRYKNQYLANEHGPQAENNQAVFDLEHSLNSLNEIISYELYAFNDIVQHTYPSYFEKFRTDGIEYDMYIGQSITPTKYFEENLLLDLRKKQILSMVEIARKTYHALDTLSVPIVTTQLIFVHPTPIDITFRQDEKRFDVEGTYNIRYEIVKKRLDKALVKGTMERLVQPNMIAIVYSTKKVETELRLILQELASQGYVAGTYDSVEIDELQGVEDLKSFRVQVQLDN